MLNTASLIRITRRCCCFFYSVISGSPDEHEKSHIFSSNKRTNTVARDFDGDSERLCDIVAKVIGKTEGTEDGTQAQQQRMLKHDRCTKGHVFLDEDDDDDCACVQ